MSCHEAYTSKTSPKCVYIHKKLGGSKIHFCPACGHKTPRYLPGALSMILRAL
ncbi:zinc ribbon domain-containing protein [Okeania sp. SIO2C9]|uniref:zinc ribbon domain-containing protein n=1 Tax=Okeania sp. SIO2C9 TaxID=2607791 RepID=UPI0025CB88E0|nr:zinc ribbon domain-containing protein [Okeania sp. SIO2C9]